MEEYNFNDNTLLHTILFNPYKLESVLKNGILSENEAIKRNIPFARNYEGCNSLNYISLIKPSYTEHEDINSAYNMYSNLGITFVIENQEYLDYAEGINSKYIDEVFALDAVNTSNIKGILLPEKYLNYNLSNLPIISLKSTSYKNIKNNVDTLLSYLKSYDYDYNEEEYNFNLGYLGTLIKAYQTDGDISDIKDALRDLDDFLGEEVESCFKKVLNKDEVTLLDMVSFINNKTLGLPIYIIKGNERVR